MTTAVQTLAPASSHQLIRYDAACKALSEARAVDEVKDIRDKSEAMRVYGRQAQNKRLEVDAAEIRIRAERRLGELLLEQKNGGGLARGGRPVETPREPRGVMPTLSQNGISYDLSARAQKLAAVPTEVFESEVSDWRGRVEAENARVTTRLEQAADKVAGEVTRDQLEEAQDNARELAHLLEGYVACEEGVHVAAKEIAKLKGQIAVLSSQRDQYMTKCNELIKAVEARDRKIKKLEAKA